MFGSNNNQQVINNYSRRLTTYVKELQQHVLMINHVK